MKISGVIVALVLAGCGSKAPKPAGPTAGSAVEAPPPAPKSLHDRLGGTPAIQAVVDEFVTNIAEDARINQRFVKTDLETLKRLLVEFVCAATGGPCKYSGRDMATSHADMELVDEEFDALVEDLVGALDKLGVPEKEKGELLGALGPLKPQIVAPPEKLHPVPEAKLAPAVKVAAAQKDKAVQDLLNGAITAAKRGQVVYAEQLFSRAELMVGPKPFAKIAGIFRTAAKPAQK